MAYPRNASHEFFVYVDASRHPCRVIAKKLRGGQTPDSLRLPVSAGRYNRRTITAYDAASAKGMAWNVRCPSGIGRTRRRRRR